MFDPSIHLPLPAGFFVRSVNRQGCLSPQGATQIRYTVTFEELASKKEESPESIVLDVIESSVPALQAHPIKAECPCNAEPSSFEFTISSSPKSPMCIETARHIAARIWCDPAYQHVVMNTGLAEGIARMLCAHANGEDTRLPFTPPEQPTRAKRWTGAAGNGDLADERNWFRPAAPAVATAEQQAVIMAGVEAACERVKAGHPLVGDAIIAAQVEALAKGPSLITAEWAPATTDIAANLRSLKDSIQKNAGLEEPCRTFAVGPQTYANLLALGWIDNEGVPTEAFNKQYGKWVEKVLNVEVLTEGNEDDTADLAKCEGCGELTAVDDLTPVSDNYRFKNLCPTCKDKPR